MPITRLEIFERFTVDYNLPKFRKDQYPDNEKSGNKMSFTHPADGLNFNENWAGTDNTPPRKLNLFARMWAKYKASRQAKRDAAEEAAKRDPSAVMDDAHVFMQNMVASMNDVMKDRMSQFDGVLESASKMGQRGLAERLTSIRQRVSYELLLAQSGQTKFLTEKQVVKLINECRKGLTVTWIRDFGRVIPQNICELKLKLDALKIFDNYVVLHFDPTKKDITPPKDPILFGVLRDSNRLYFVADWIDDVCDFTLEKAEKFLTDSGEKNPVGNIMNELEN